MYYKDDFYKEFRTEKELCEYLEEIDSRAEWIRITSKKLKVAAAGEETCTEVPGISLEALEKDTLSHSRLVLILPERICYIGNSAIKSLKGRARIDGKALADVDKKTLAEILNKCLKVARGRALIRFCEGKIRAVLSGDEKDYAIISMPDMYMVTSAYIHGDYEKPTFLNGYADHYSVTASWQLEDTKLTDVYKELMQNYGRKTDKDIKAVVRITTSDVGVSGANIFYSLQEPTRNVILGNALKVTHKNCKGMEDFTENIESIFDYYREVLKGVMRLCDIWIEHPANAMAGIMKQAGFGKKLLAETVEQFKATTGNEPCSAYEIYCGICESITIARQEKTNERGLLALEEKIAGCVSKRWHEYDIPGTVKY